MTLRLMRNPPIRMEKTTREKDIHYIIIRYIMFTLEFTSFAEREQKVKGSLERERRERER